MEYLFYYIACLQLNVAFSYEFMSIIIRPLAFLVAPWGGSAPTWEMLS
jgi:hypothetical protein